MQLLNLPKTQPLHRQHDTFESDATAWLRAQGFLCHSATYHNTMPADMINVLRLRNSLTAIYLRGRADRIAIHKTKPIEFEYECKTHDRPDKHDLTLELTPLCFHLAKARHGVECLYMYRHNGRDKGFWIRETPSPRVIMLPDRWNETQQDFFEIMAREYFPKVNVVRNVRSFGSGDPFLVIDASEVNGLKLWRDLVGVKLER